MSINIDVVRFDTNFIWIIKKDSECIVIDPGEAAPVQDYLAKHKLICKAILLTHYHGDHIGGCEALNQPALPIYGPAYEPIHLVNRPVKEGDQLHFFDEDISVLFTPGHTAGHIVYVMGNHCFCGDVLFSGGCGRVFEGTHETMYYSVQKCMNLPKDTLFYCGHEYTETNLEFALVVEPKNNAVQARLAEAKACRKVGKPTVPSTAAQELSYNPFCRVHEQSVKGAVEKEVGRTLNSSAEVFSELRHWKNRF